MDDAEVLQVAKARQKLDGEATDEAVVEALVIVHLDELV